MNENETNSKAAPATSDEATQADQTAEAAAQKRRRVRAVPHTESSINPFETPQPSTKEETTEATKKPSTK